MAEQGFEPMPPESWSVTLSTTLHWVSTYYVTPPPKPVQHLWPHPLLTYEPKTVQATHLPTPLMEMHSLLATEGTM